MESKSGVGTSAGRGFFVITAIIMLARIDNRRAAAKSLAKNQRMRHS
jgi:hypothetical protein